jgi:hypothetical protein
LKIHGKILLSLLIALLSLSVLGQSLSSENAQLTPYSINGTIAANAAVWHNIYYVKQNDLVLISISASNLIDAAIYYPNLTVCASEGFTDRPTFQFNALQTATYLLKLSGWEGNSANYSINSSHPFDPIQTPTSTPTLTPSPTPTNAPTVTPTTFPTITVVANKTEDFDAFKLFGVNDKTATFTWNYGDNTPPVTTTNVKVTHIYQQTGTFNITLTVNEAGTGLTQNFNIPVTVVEPPPSLLVPIATITAAIITAGVTIGLYYQKKKDKEKAKKIKTQKPTKNLK